MEFHGSARYRVKRAISVEAFIFLIVVVGAFALLGAKMGIANMFNTMMNTAYRLLLDTVFYIMAIAVVAGALSSLFSEFGVIALINKVLSPLMRPVYDMPGAASMGVVATYLSDNPAILTLAQDMNFRRYFKKYQIPALTNIGTAFGMGLIVTTFMIGIAPTGGEGYGLAIVVGNISAVIGSIVSTRIMLVFTKKAFGKDTPCELEGLDESLTLDDNHRLARKGGVGLRAIDALLAGGKSGVQMGLDIIPGVLVICTLVMMLSNSPAEGGVFTGAAYEGVGILPKAAEAISGVLKPLFGFTSSGCIAVPITALGSAGAAIGIVPQLIDQGLAGANDIAVFTAMCMCWSGYLSTHVAMMDALKCNELTGKAILSHTVGGFVAGVAANWIFKGLSLLL